jgi:serine/threonine protein kinase
MRVPPTRVGRYRLLNPLSRTRNSIVYVIAEPGSPVRLAVKLIDVSTVPLSRIDNECSVQTMLSHPYIMPVRESFDCDGYRALLMPRAAGGSLFEYRIGSVQIDPVSLTKVVYRLFKSIHYLHARHILHGDIKPGNILLQSTDVLEPIPVLIDFGHASTLRPGESCHCRLMTCAYSAPELLGLKHHSFPSDIWSLAVTIYFLVTGNDLLRLDSLPVMSRAAATLKLYFSEDIWTLYPDSLQILLTDMLMSDPDARPTIAQCLQYRFFEDVLGSEWIERENAAVPLCSCETDCMSPMIEQKAGGCTGVSMASIKFAEL